MIKAIIFDMDGVLIEAKDWHFEALNRALRLFSYEISRHDHLTTYDGLPTSKKLEMLTAECGLPVELHSFINEMKQIYTMEIIHTRCKPSFLHEYALSKLKAMGYKLAVASNSVRSTVEIMMHKARLDKYLEFMLSNEDVTNPKPHPEIYEKAIKNFRLSPEECIVLEDNENGIRSATAAGTHVLTVKEVTDANINNILSFISSREKEKVL